MTITSFEGRNALIFALTGAIGGAVSTELTRQGARFFLDGPGRQGLEQLADRLGNAARVEIKTCLVNDDDRDPRELEALAFSHRWLRLARSRMLLWAPAMHFLANLPVSPRK